jgi:hypothetical protein
MISIAHFTSAEPDFEQRAQLALSTLATRAGYVRGSLSRAMDEPAHWVIVTEWENVGSYRRALGAYEVKLHAAPLLGEALDMPSGFETVADAAPDGTIRLHATDSAQEAFERGG